MNTIAIIQARLGSSRLPDKVLADINGKPLIERLLERVAATNGLDEIVVATTLTKRDDRLVEWLEARNCAVFRGSEDDVLDRYFNCAKLYGSDLIVRITADDPLKDPEIIEQALSICRNDPKVDYASNTLAPSYPEGLDVEVFRMESLSRAYKNARKQSEREHVTPYIWTQKNKFNLVNFFMTPNLSSWRWTVDYPQDLDLVRAIYQHFGNDSHFSYRQAIQFVHANPSIIALNTGPIRNEGYIKSIEKDL